MGTPRASATAFVGGTQEDVSAGAYDAFPSYTRGP